MDEDELEELSKEIATVAKESHTSGAKLMLLLMMYFGRIISHLRSEQRRFTNLDAKIGVQKKAIFGDETDLEARPGLKHDMTDVKKFIASQKWFQRAVITLLLGLFGKSIWEIIAKHP